MAEEIQVDLDAADREAAKKASQAKPNGAKDPKIDTVEVKAAEPAAKTPDREIITPDAGLEKLKKQLEDEKQARADADRRAQEAAESEARARGEVQSSQLDFVKSTITQVTQANDALEARYADALAAQDYAAAAKINREMGANSAKILALETAKERIEKAPKPTPRAAPDPVDQFAAQLTPKSAAWVRAHPDFVRDANKNRQMLAAHELALGRGIKADTDEYFESIEDTLRIKAPIIDPADPDDPDPMKDAAATPTRKAPPPAAPVTRSGNGAGNRSNVVTLSAQEVEIAEMNGLTPEQYARNKVQLKKEGRLN
jgi:hypothetical protein